MRVSMQCGRNGSAIHNEHTHVEERDRDVKIYDATNQPGESLRAKELAFYRATFGAGIDERNARYRQQRHPEKCRTVEQIYTAKKTRPEEVILQIGKKGDTVNRETFLACVRDFFKRVNVWNREHGRPFKTLNTVAHFDETTAHLHWRRVWLYTDQDGYNRIGQTEALRRAGVSLPQQGRFDNEKESRYNNRKITFDGMVREMWQTVCKEHGLQIETEPLPSRRHLETEQFIDRQISKKNDQLNIINGDVLIAALKQQVAEEQLTRAEQQLSDASEQLKTTVNELDDTKARLQAQNEVIDRVEHVLKQTRELASVFGQEKNVDKQINSLEDTKREISKTFGRER